MRLRRIWRASATHARPESFIIMLSHPSDADHDCEILGARAGNLLDDSDVRNRSANRMQKQEHASARGHPSGERAYLIPSLSISIDPAGCIGWMDIPQNHRAAGLPQCRCADPELTVSASASTSFYIRSQANLTNQDLSWIYHLRSFPHNIRTYASIHPPPDTRLVQLEQVRPRYSL